MNIYKRSVQGSDPYALRLLMLLFKAVDKAIHVCRADVAANDAVSVDDDVSVYRTLVIGVVGDLICIARSWKFFLAIILLFSIK